MNQSVEPPSISEPPRAADPERAAATLALAYAVLASGWILGSSAVARRLSPSLQALQFIETVKGVAFVVVTGLFLFFLSRAQLVRLRNHERHIRRMDRALANADQGVLAGMLATTVAHDINNALTAGRMAVEELAQRTAADVSARELTRELDTALERIGTWNRRFFELGRSRGVGQPAPFDLADALRSCAQMVRHHQKVEGVELTLDVPDRSPMRGYPTSLQRAVLNLILNAAEASGARGVVRVSVSNEPDRSVTIRVDDSGPGVPLERRADILRPFYTTKADGTGLGLASVTECADLHGGSVEVLDSPLGGARFELRLRSAPA